MLAAGKVLQREVDRCRSGTYASRKSSSNWRTLTVDDIPVKPGQARSSIAKRSRCNCVARAATERSTDVHVYRIRRKLKKRGSELLRLDTVYGRGYILKVDRAAETVDLPGCGSAAPDSTRPRDRDYRRQAGRVRDFSDRPADPASLTGRGAVLPRSEGCGPRVDSRSGPSVFRPSMPLERS